MKSLTWVCAALLAACGGSKDAASPDGSMTDADPGADASPPRAPATRFAEQAMNFTVPASGLSDGFAQSSAFASARYWTTIDLDGDKFFEIAQTGDTAFTQRVWDATGNPYWKVFSGGANGWSATAVTWSVPKNGRTEGFFAAGATGAGIEWTLLDVDGDKRPDMIHSLDPATGAVWDSAGNAHWKVYLGTAGGFAAAPMAWRVPASGTFGGFTRTSSRSGAQQWVTIDINRDGKLDLVQTADPVTGNVWDAASAPHWKVFVGSGSGFATTATLWSVPANGVTTGFHATSFNSATDWVTVDLDQDGKLDLVQTSDPATGNVWDAAGAPYWKLFRGTATGFETTPKTWRVPKSGLADGFSVAQSATTSRYWSLVDLDGDDDLDLVQTSDTAFTRRVWDATGNPYWKVFANTRDGFSDQLYRWPVPTGPTDGFAELTAAASPNHWFVADVDADGYRDLVQTMNPATFTVWDATGSAYWKVYRGQP